MSDNAILVGPYGDALGQRWNTPRYISELGFRNDDARHAAMAALLCSRPCPPSSRYRFPFPLW